MAYIEARNIYKIYQTGEVKTVAVENVSFTFEEGEFIVIVGQSGAGKTTLLNLLGGMDTPTKGYLRVADRELHNADPKELTTYRRHDIGFVFQFYNLVPNLTAQENVELASELVDDPFDPVEMLAEVGLGERIQNFPAQLSGGEQQRVAIARAIAKNPRLLLCDEPTGALDYETGKTILALLQRVSHQQKMTTIIITHNQVLADMADRVLRMRSGQIVEDYRNERPKLVEELSW